jgi:CRP-like cAMP-binding protein
MLALLEKLIVLGESSLFEGMTSEELHPVGEIAEPVDLDPGDVAVRQGDPGDAIFVIAEGTLAVTKDGLKLKEVGRGSVFGEVALLDGGPRSASVEAVTRTRLLRIPRAEFEALIDQHPEIARGIIRTLLAHLRGSG